MAATVDECVASFSRQAVVVDRTYARVFAWAAYTGALPLPPNNTAPDPEVVRQRILAERTPTQASTYAQQITPYLLGIPNITARIREHMSAWNDEETETSLSTDIDGSLATVMPRYAKDTISDYDVALWCDKNGYPRPDGLVPPLPPTPTPPV
jgi:hypothetical protein